MKKCFALIILIFISFTALQAQVHKVAIFTPLYLDSAFDAKGGFRYEKVGAKFVTPGLDFYYGVQMAIDSLQKRGAPLEVFVYDTKAKESIGQQLARPELTDVELVIAQANATETKMIAEAAQRKKIPFISATLPNDAGIVNNPYFVVLNTTLQSHVEGVYRYLQKYYPSSRIIVFRKSGAQEDQIKNYFMEFGKATTSRPLNVQFVEGGANFTPQALTAVLDSTKKNIIVAGSLDENFGNRLAQQLAGLSKKYPSLLMGMPTWDNFNLTRTELAPLEIVYTAPFFYNRATPLETSLASDFSTKMGTRASDMFFRGYEAMLRFSLLMLDTKKDVASNLTRKGNYVFTPFDIQPVFKDSSAMTLDYFENRHLYFIKVLGGSRNVMY